MNRPRQVVRMMNQRDERQLGTWAGASLKTAIVDPNVGFWNQGVEAALNVYQKLIIMAILDDKVGSWPVLDGFQNILGSGIISASAFLHI